MRYLISFILLLCIVLPARAGTVLVVESYHSGFEWDARYVQAIREQLPEHTVVTFEMDTKRLPPSMHAARADAAFSYYKQINPDLVVLGDDNANRLLGRRFVKEGVPLVYLGINNNPRDYGLYGHSQVAGVLERPLIKRSVHFAKRLGITPFYKVLFLFDDGATARLLFQKVFEDSHAMQLLGVQADVKMIGTFADWSNVVQEARHKGYHAVFIGLYQTVRDASGTVMPDSEILSYTVKNLEIPCFGLWDFSVGPDKTLGGLVHSSHDQGVAAGMLAKQLLAGERNLSLPVTAEQGALIFSRSGLARWGIVLPAMLKRQARMVD